MHSGIRKRLLPSMIEGVQPTEPCSECGEVPEFGDAVMSLDFQGDGPVKGVDGQEYTTCPQCGEEALELQGRSLADWGWTIVCPDCGWEKKQAEGLDIGQYCDLMEEAKSRLESIGQLLDMPGISSRTRVESMCLQLRMLLELVVFSSLVSNKDVWQRSKQELQSSRDMSKKLKELKRLHPNFYPTPLDLERDAPGKEPADRTGGFMDEATLMEVYGRLGNILHAENPMGKETDYGSFMGAVPNWVTAV